MASTERSGNSWPWWALALTCCVASCTEGARAVAPPLGQSAKAERSPPQGPTANAGRPSAGPTVDSAVGPAASSSGTPLPAGLDAGPPQTKPSATASPRPYSPPGPPRPAGTLAAGTRFATPFYILDSGKPGPTVLVLAGTHGDEPAPSPAAKQLLGWSLVRGRLLIIPELNPPALAAKTRYTPKARHADLNRNFPFGRRDVRGELAPLLWQQTQDWHPDWILDLHEGWGVHHNNPKTVGSTVTWVSNTEAGARAKPVGEQVIAAINDTIDKPYKRFELIAPGPAGSFARSVSEKLAIPSLVLETTRVGQQVEHRVEQQLLMVRIALREIGVVR